MAQGQRQQFLQGLAGGAVGTLVGGGALVFALSHYGVVAFTNDRVPSLDGWFTWATLNLGSSIPVFAGLLLAFFYSLSRLRRLLDDAGPLERIVQLDHLTDTWTTLFFGTGVIWTAIGMRSALIFALGDPDVSVQEGAFKMLERMVEGGILLALSTTIFGGIGGYLMRVYKAIALGSRLQARYDREARSDTTSMRDSLTRIEQHLQAGTPP
ncbi:MAG: hypothetical protein QNI96_15000 [Woeseiaceae bacterium]|nr:hypothetical protein [Woeseiaceae bacterium]